MRTEDSPQYTFQVPVGWVRQVQRPGTAEQFTMSFAGYSNFKFTLFKYKVPSDGSDPSLAELCALQDKLRDETGARGTYEKKDYTIDGRLCCYGIFREMELEVHVLTAFMNGELYTFYYQFESKPVLDSTKETVTAEMERLFHSWHWKTPAASPSPSPTPVPSYQPHLEFPDYFPAIEGSSWTYRVILDGATVGSLETTAEEVSVTGKLGTPNIKLAKHWVVSKPIPGHPTSDETELLDKNLFGVNRIDGQTSTPLLKALPKAGLTWDANGHHFAIESMDETVPTALEPVIGAMKVVETAPDGTKVSRWYTQDLGLVQEINETTSQKLSLILESYVEGP